MGIDLTDYVEVKDRIAEFKRDYPDGRLVSEIVPSGFDGFVTVKAYAYRTPDDPTPGVGLAWEPVPGQTPYTKNSELQNAETSAWGRALVAALVADASTGVASANEVRNREDSGPPVLENLHCPECGSGVVNNLSAHSGNNKQPAFKCSNKNCQGGGAKKKGDGRWPWATWDADFFRHEDPDPNDPEPIREDFPEGEFPPGEEPF